MKTIFLFFIFSLSQALALEIVPLNQNEDHAIQCSERQQIKFGQLKKEILRWENKALHTQYMIKHGLLNPNTELKRQRLESQHQELISELKDFKLSDKCYYQRKESEHLSLRFSQKIELLKFQQTVAQVRLCEIQLKNTSKTFSQGITSLEENHRQKAFLFFGEATFEVDRILKTSVDCQENEKEKLREIREHSLATLNSIQFKT